MNTIRSRFEMSLVVSILLVQSACASRAGSSPPAHAITPAVGESPIAEPDPLASRMKRAMSGGMNGGGGRAVVCRANGAIVSAELLDLYEARVLYGLVPRAPEATEDADWARAAAELGAHFNDFEYAQPEIGGYIRESFDDITTIIRLPNQLQPVLDSNEPVLPGDCAVEQLAYFYEDDRLLVQGEIWDRLDVLDRSALKTHEWVYRMTRQSGEEDSRVARRFVGHFYSTTGLLPKRAAALALSRLPNAIRCDARPQGDSVEPPFWFVMQQGSEDRANFAFVMGRIDANGLYATLRATDHPSAFPGEEAGFYKTIFAHLKHLTPIEWHGRQSSVLFNFDTFSPDARTGSVQLYPNEAPNPFDPPSDRLGFTMELYLPAQYIKRLYRLNCSLWTAPQGPELDR